MNETDQTAPQPGVTVRYQARMGHDLSGRDVSGWGVEVDSPLEAVAALSWKVGEGDDGLLAFGPRIKTIHRSFDGDAQGLFTKWQEFCQKVMADEGEKVELVLLRRHWSVERQVLECVEGPGPDCEGPCDWHSTNPGVSEARVRCQKHWCALCDRLQGINERYPDSPFPPADFDPTYAGERWDDDY